MVGEIVYGGYPDTVFTDTLNGGTPDTVFPAAGPVLTPQSEGAPVPSVQIVISEVAAGTQVVNVYRLADGRTTLVRGGVRKFAIGGAALVDWEAPFGVPITYRAEMFADEAATESLGFTEPSSTVLDVRSAWIHQPLNPSLSVRPTMLWGTALERKRTTPGDLVYTQDADAAVWVGGKRRGLEGVPFRLLTDNAGADAFQAVLGGYGSNQSAVLCIRTPAEMRVPRTFFAVVSDVTESNLDRPGASSSQQFDFTATEARPPAPGLVVALLRRMDVDFTYPTRAARAAAYATRRDRDADFSLAGVAGDA